MKPQVFFLLLLPSLLPALVYAQSLGTCENPEVVPTNTSITQRAWPSRFNSQKKVTISTCLFENKLLPEDGIDNMRFGVGNAIYDDYAFVGAWGDNAHGPNSGSAYIYKKNNQIWQLEQKISPADGDSGDQFGVTIGAWGDYCIVGAMADKDNGTESGSTYIYRKTPNSYWVEEAKLLPEDGSPFDYFGSSVDIYEDYAIVGAFRDGDNGSYSGSAYIFHRENGNWVQQSKLLPSDGKAGAWFGADVAIHGDYAVIGAHLDKNNGTDSGAAYVFRRNGNSWEEVAKLIPSDGEPQDYFGFGVNIYQDHIVIGAAGNDDLGRDCGSIYIFQNIGGSWVEVQKITADNLGQGFLFGSDVAIFGDLLAASAQGSDINGNRSGSVYLYKKTAGAWLLDQEIYPSDGNEGDEFRTCSIFEDQLLVASLKDDDIGTDGGSVYIFDLNCSDISPCSISQDEILCQDWLQTKLTANYQEYCQGTYCLVVGGVPPFASLSTYLTPTDDRIIGISWGECLDGAEEYYDCAGTLLASCTFSIDPSTGNRTRTCDNQAFVSGLTEENLLWSCADPLPDCSTGSTAVTMMITPGQSEVCAGETLCADFQVKDFSDISETRFTITWDPTVLAFQSVADLNSLVTGLDIADFNTSEVDQGRLHVEWKVAECDAVTPGQGITLDDCAGTCLPTLFRVCFSAISGDVGATTLSLAPDRFLGKDNTRCNNVGLGVEPARITICMNPQNSLTVVPRIVKPGDPVEVAYTLLSTAGNAQVHLGDGSSREISDLAGSFSYIFPGPGSYEISLRVDNQTFTTQWVHVQSCGWAGHVESLNGYREPDEDICDIVTGDGRIYLSPNLTPRGYYWTEYENIRSFGISGDEAHLAARIKVPAEEGAINAYEASLAIYGSEGVASFYSGGISGGIRAADTRQQDIASMRAHHAQWTLLELVVSDGTADVYFDGELKHSLPYTGRVGQVEGIGFGAKGSGSVDWMRLYRSDGMLAYEETFDDCSLNEDENCGPVNPTTDSYTLYAEPPSSSSCTGETICINFTVENFTSISGTKFTLNWDPAVLNFLSVGQFNPEVTGLDLGEIDFSKLADGLLTVDWKLGECDQITPGEGITLDDCFGNCRPTLFEVCFHTLGGEGASTRIDLEPGHYTTKDISCTNVSMEMQSATIETCGEGIGDCPFPNTALSCGEWLRDTIAFYYDPRYGCDPPNEGMIVSLIEKDANYLIELKRFAPPVEEYRYYDCAGNLVGICGAESGVWSCDIDLASYEFAANIWRCFDPLPNCNEPPWEPQPCTSGNTHFISVLYEHLESDIGGQPLAPGDWLGVFYEKDDGSLVCMDMAQFADPALENGFQLSVCAESGPGADDGFAADEPFRFKAYKNGEEYDAGQLSIVFWGEGELIPPIFPDAGSRFEGGGRSSAIRSINDFPVIVPPDCTTPIPIACGQTISGHNGDGTDNAVSYNCFTNLVDGPEVTYAFTLDQREDVLIRLDGLTDDLELLLLDACDRDQCIAKSERTGDSPEVILYPDLPPGDYFIIVDGYVGYESPYNLSLDCGDYPQGEFTCPPETISCGQIVNGHTAEGCSEVNFYNCSEAYTPGREKVYRVRFEERTNARIVLEPQGADLELFLLDALDPNRCLYYSNESGEETERIVLEPGELILNRDYYIVVDGFYADRGASFQLAVECIPPGEPCPWCPPQPGICDEAIEITCNETVSGHTRDGSSRVAKWGDCPSYNEGPELIYRFHNPQTQDVEIILSDFTENLNFYVLRDQCSVNACDSDWAGNKSGLIKEDNLFKPLPQGDYFIIVDSYDAPSSFSLQVKCKETAPCFEVDVEQGFSYISSNRRPGDDPSIENILPKGRFEGVSIILSDDRGNTFDPHFSTPRSPGTIEEWRLPRGYRIDVSEPITLEFCGEEADPAAMAEVIALSAAGEVQKNLIGYPFPDPMPVTEAFAGSPAGNLFSVSYRFPNDGQRYLDYKLALDIGDDFTMEPGKGYFLVVTDDGDFSFRSEERAFMPNGCTFFRTPLRNTLERAFVRAPGSVLSQALSPGDEIGIFTEDGLLCGSGKFLGGNRIITLLGDDPQTGAREGFMSGEEMQARIWRSADGKVEEVVLEFADHSPEYESNDIYLLKSISIRQSKDAHRDHIAWQFYPNPAYDHLYVEYMLPSDGTVQLRLYSVDGRIQRAITDGGSAGVHQVPIDVKAFTSGLYFLQLTAGSYSETRKVVLQK